MLKAIGNFLFGRNPDIFNERGEVVHKLSREKWEAWHKRTKIDPQYNWRNHTGMNAGRKPEQRNK